jgi:hypothetical protein
MTVPTAAEALAAAVTAERLAEANLAEVQQAARAEIATPEDLGAARNRLEHATHVREGRDQAAAAAQARGDRDRQQQAKAEAAAIVAEAPDLVELHDQVTAAYEALVSGLQQHHRLLARAADILEAGGVTSLRPGFVPDGYDPENFAHRADGWVATAVTAGGVTLSAQQAGLWARSPLKIVAERHGLTDGQGKRIVNVLGRDVPDALRAR